MPFKNWRVNREPPMNEACDVFKGLEDSALLDVAIETPGEEQALAILRTSGDDGEHLCTGDDTDQVVIQFVE